MKDKVEISVLGLLMIVAFWLLYGFGLYYIMDSKYNEKDLNKDGKVDIIDLLELQRYILGKDGEVSNG